MHLIIDKVSARCLAAGIIEADELDWFGYAIEKRMTTLLTGTLLMLIAVAISDFWTAFFYLGSFYFLRVRTNGYHARGFVGCLGQSIILELVSLFCLSL